MSEQFALDFAPSERPDAWLDWHGRKAVLVDAQPAFEAIGEGATLLYQNVIPGAYEAEFTASFAAQVISDVVSDSIEIDVDSTTPLPEAEFWQVMSALGGAVSARGTRKLRAALAKRSPEFIAAFGVRLVLAADDLNRRAIARAADQDSMAPGGDAFLWWRMAILARGPEFVAGVASGVSTIEMDEGEWAAGEGLVEVAGEAYERRTGNHAVFFSGADGNLRVPVPAQVDYTGERSADPMIAAGLAPTNVGSRFVVAKSSELVDCVAIQTVDVDREDTTRVLTVLAEEMSARIGGVLVSIPLMNDLHTLGFGNGQEFFVSKQRHIVDVGHYRAVNGLGAEW
jgi:hypothetical protein